MTTVDVLVQGNQDVAAAAKQILVALREGGSRDAATESLVRVAEASSRETRGLVTQGLTAHEAEGATVGSTADLVATALAEISQSNVLLAAGVALDDDQSGDGLEQALVELDRTTDALIADVARHGGWLGFAADEVRHGTPEQATVEGFRIAVSGALDAIVETSAHLATAIVRGAGSLPPEQVAKASGRLGTQLARPIGVLKRLVSIGLEKLRSAVNTLMRVLGEERARALRDWIAGQWEKLQRGELLKGPLAVLLGAGTTGALADSIVPAHHLTAERIEDASVRIVAVSEQFGRTAVKLEVHAGTLESAAKWGLAASKLVPQLTPWVTGAAIAGYMALLGIGLLLAMDVADAGIDLGRVVGVRGIVTGLSV